MLLKGESSVIAVEVRIRRGISEFFVNNKPQKKDKLRELRRMLKIDLSNRVADFVAQTPQKRLREFEKSVGGESFVRLATTSDV